MSGENGDPVQGPMMRAVHMVLPWLALLVIVWVLAGAWGAFRSAQQAISAAGVATSTVNTTSTAPASTATTVTGMVAVALQEIKLRVLPTPGADVLATVKKGSSLTVVAKQGQYLRLKDSAGHIGWVPNDVQLLQISAKPKKK